MLNTFARQCLEGGEMPGFMTIDDLPAALPQISVAGRRLLMDRAREQISAYRMRLDDEHEHRIMREISRKGIAANEKKIAIIEASLA